MTAILAIIGGIFTVAIVSVFMFGNSIADYLEAKAAELRARAEQLRKEKEHDRDDKPSKPLHTRN